MTAPTNPSSTITGTQTSLFPGPIHRVVGYPDGVDQRPDPQNEATDEQDEEVQEDQRFRRR
jgi:hypothetical protein